MKIAFIRGSQLNPFETQSYIPLLGRFEIVAFASRRPAFDLTQVRLSTVQLPTSGDVLAWLPAQIQRMALLASRRVWAGAAEWMFGLERHLAGFQIAHVAELVNGYSYQAVRAKRRANCAVVVTCWENIPFNFEFFSRANRRMKSEVAAEADHFIAVTNGAADALRLEGVAGHRITVIPAGIDTARFAPRASDPRFRSTLGLSPDDFVILFVGRLTPEKGPLTLVHAAGLVRDRLAGRRGRRLAWVLAGAGPVESTLRDRIIRLGLNDTVRVIPPLSYADIPALHNEADVFVLPSAFVRGWQEQFGMVLVESMATGKPIVAACSGAIPEVLGDVALLVPPEDPRALCDAILRLVESSDLRAELGGRARERAVTRFDAARVACALGDLYAAVGHG